MNSIKQIQKAGLSPLAAQFARFCNQLDPQADEIVLATTALLAHRNAQQGDTCLDLSLLARKPLLTEEKHTENKVKRTILLDAPELERWKKQLVDAAFIGIPGDYHPLILEDTRLYLHRHWLEEQIITDAIKARFGAVEVDKTWLRKRLDALFGKLAPNDNAYGQKLAAAMTLTRKLAIITGGPGTGKTTTVTRILALLLEENPDLRISLAAPTGKAAARLIESIGEQIVALTNNVDSQIINKLPRQASTIHRLLGWQRDGFTHNADNLLPCDCLLLDESSMVDQGMMANLLIALPEHCRVILLGDRDQLSSVEAGSVLGDLTGHGRNLGISPTRAQELSGLLNELPANLIDDEAPTIADHIAQLTFSYRFNESGGIGQLAKAVNTGNTDKIVDLLSKPNDHVAWIEATGKQPGNSVIDWAIEHYKPVFESTSAEDALKAFDSARLLTALRVGPWGETAIREKLEARLMSNGLLDRMGNTPARGLPLIIRRNDRETGLFNGDTGIFWPDDDGVIMAWFPMGGESKGLSPFSVHQLPEWQSAWALTVHRSQGSEYKNILLLLPPEESAVVSRELIYTGITRTANYCTIVGHKKLFSQSIRKITKRLSGLGDRIGWNELQR